MSINLSNFFVVATSEIRWLLKVHFTNHPLIYLIDQSANQSNPLFKDRYLSYGKINVEETIPFFKKPGMGNKDEHKRNSHR